MPTLTIDGQSIEVEEGTTVLEAARKLGIQIPTLCYREGCEPPTACMVCVVRINGSENLVPSCGTQVAEGMEVESESGEIRTARRMALELLLGDHVGDCLGPCQMVCPAHLDIPGMMRLIEHGQTDAAVRLVKERIPFPATLGRICSAPCENGCRRGDVDDPVSIRLLKRYVGDYDLSGEAPYIPECEPPTERHVGIIGAGPAGLTAAYYLLEKGHDVTLIDRHPQGGGGLRYGVPDDELPPEVLEAEIQTVMRMGAAFRGGVEVGEDVALDEVAGEFDTVLIAAGEVPDDRDRWLGLEISGRSLKADRDTQMTPREGVFVAGSSLSPSRHAVRAVGSGRTAAESIHLHLMDIEDTVRHRPYSVTMGRLDDEELELFAQRASRKGRTVAESGEGCGFTDDEAHREARRCMHCECSALGSCRLRHWAMEYDADLRRFRGDRDRYVRDESHPLLVYEPGKCIKCGLCVQIAERERDALGLTFIGRGFNVRVGAPLDASLTEALDETARACAEACPTGALTLREKPQPGGDTDTFEPAEGEP